MRTPAALSDDLVTIYLNDHLGGATFGRELARRMARANRGTEFGPPLAEIADEVAADRDELIAVMRRMDCAEDRLKVAGGWLAERAGRLKPNGRLRGYSPLSRVLELETLAAGVEGKLALWRLLRLLAPERPELDAPRLEGLIASARQQQSRLFGLHTRAGELALAERPAGSRA